MARQTLNNLQVYGQKSWSGLTIDNHIGTVFNEQPTLLSNIMSRVFGMYSYTGMDTLISMLGSDEETPSDADYEWYLKGDDEKAIKIVGFDAADPTRPGVNNTRFRVTLEEKYFAYTDKLVFDDRRYSVRIMAEPYSDGLGGWVHEVEHMKGDPTFFIPPAQLATNKKLSKEYSPQERTLSKTAGETSYTAPFKMRNSFGTLRKTYTIPGNMHQRPLVIEMMDPKSSKTTKIWTQYAEWEFMCQWYKEKNRQLMYAESNKTSNGAYLMKGESGNPIIEFSGIREQISPAYRFYYTDFTIDWLEDVLLNLSINILPEDQRHFVALTGERGFIQFHRALENHVARFQPLDSKRVSGSGQNLGFQGQYREYMGPQGVKFTLIHLPEYDNPVTNRTLHPDGGLVESYRYTILNFGTTNGKKNIRRVYPRGRKELMWHIAGSTSPLGPMTSFSRGSASAVDGYELHCQATQSVVIENPMSCAELIYAAA